MRISTSIHTQRRPRKHFRTVGAAACMLFIACLVAALIFGDEFGVFPDATRMFTSGALAAAFGAVFMRLTSHRPLRKRECNLRSRTTTRVTRRYARASSAPQ